MQEKSIISFMNFSIILCSAGLFLFPYSFSKHQFEFLCITTQGNPICLGGCCASRAPPAPGADEIILRIVSEFFYGFIFMIVTFE